MRVMDWREVARRCAGGGAAQPFGQQHSDARIRHEGPFSDLHDQVQKPIAAGNNSELGDRSAISRKPKTSNHRLRRPGFSQEFTRQTATTGLLEQRLFERLRLNRLAQPEALSAPPRSAKPRSHSGRREVKALAAC